MTRASEGDMTRASEGEAMLTADFSGDRDTIPGEVWQSAIALYRPPRRGLLGVCGLISFVTLWSLGCTVGTVVDFTRVGGFWLALCMIGPPTVLGMILGAIGITLIVIRGSRPTSRPS